MKLGGRGLRKAGSVELLLKWSRVSDGGSDQVPDMDGDDGCTTMDLPLLSCTIRMVKTIHFAMSILLHKK